MPKEPQRNYRCPAPLYEAAMAKAARNGESLAVVIRRALEEYVQPKATPRRHPLRRAGDQQQQQQQQPQRQRRSA